MSAEENKAVVRRAAEAVSSGDLAAFDELMAPVVAAEFKEGIAELRQSFPNYHGADEIQVAEGDMVAGRFVFHGTRGRVHGYSSHRQAGHPQGSVPQQGGRWQDSGSLGRNRFGEHTGADRCRGARGTG